MKRSKDKEHLIVKQLKGSQCVINYCKDIVKAFFEKTSFLNGYTEYFVSICHTSINKRPIRTKSKTTKFKTGALIKIMFQKEIQFRKVLGAEAT